MSKMIQVRDVPERLHRELVRRAKRRHLTLTDFIHDLLRREVARPVPEDVFDAIDEMPPVEVRTPAARLIVEERRSRDVS